MASLLFEGEFKELSDKQCLFIRDVLEKRGFINNKVTFAPVGLAGDNYASNVKRITVEVPDGENFQMIAKIANTIEEIRAFNSADLLFNNESTMYEEVLPMLKKLQQDAGVPDDETITYAECYGCNTEAPNEVILLEDLKLRDFSMLDKYQSLPNEAVKMILKNFAILHSLSHALKKSNPQVYNQYRNKLRDLWIETSDRPEFVMMSEQLENNVMSIFEETEVKYKNALKGAITNMSIMTKKLTIADANSKYSVIQQGDSWTNNIMFKLQNNEITECIMIDYQLSKESNPVCDILYMIFNCTDHETRSKHFYEWIDYYHEQLDTALHYFGMKANFIYPKDQLDADLKRYAKQYFGTAILVLSVIFRTAEEAVQIKDAMNDTDLNKMGETMSVTGLSAETVAFAKNRIIDLVNTCFELGFK
ncbi:unnamed protein product [Chilo suppressalis]|uniref:CHK kinase-like domain-containing protein n=1 Tax=Chilo suppressalis TaxID=168631 RepID=A0ABN8AS01_CHISP|nr:unnamed protein product [Chilo suppressalis]